jgi:hypothetical protein
MEFIAHRINTIEQLKDVPYNFGVELDLRDHGDRLILQHDPFTDGEDFEEYLKNYRHQTMILNIKSERIEWKVLDLIKKYNITKYFFLDCSFPMIVQLANSGETNIALRYSEYEGIDTIRNMQGKVNWVWVDCFTKPPLDAATYNELKDMGLSLCLVSPELQGQSQAIETHKRYYQSNNIVFDAICTKLPYIDHWLS